MDRSDAFCLISMERERQDEKWGPASIDASDPYLMLAALTEEVGEVAKALLERNMSELFTEVVQVAALAVKWLEGIPVNHLTGGDRCQPPGSEYPGVRESVSGRCQDGGARCQHLSATSAGAAAATEHPASTG